jgi:cobyrinic acid a,c-diamide synthase
LLFSLRFNVDEVMNRFLPAFVIAGTHSGVGKTTITLGLLAVLRRRGLNIRPFKIGPDFIDPGLHREAAGAASYNLDGWMLSRGFNLQSLRRHCEGKEAAVVEGMMGLFDGYDGQSERGSTAEMAKWLGLPVVLVVDASAMARSAAAMILGYLRFDPKVNVIGVIFNRIGGKGHLLYLKEAVAPLRNIEIFGGLPQADDITIPERHLGLMTAEEGSLDQNLIRRLARWIEQHLDIDLLLRRSRVRLEKPDKEREGRERRKPVSIGVAQDKAFCFYYPDNLNLLQAAGARIVAFSPIRDRALPPGVKALYLGGGYPEVYARELARNRSMRNAVRNFVEAGGLVYAECGGFMYLTESLGDLRGRSFPMVGVYPFTTQMLPQLRALGYREVKIDGDSFFPSGMRARGHEFHYSAVNGKAKQDRGVKEVYSVSPEAEREGFVYKNCLGSYIHLHFGSNPTIASRLVETSR